MIAAVAPSANPRRAITQIRLRICVEKPEGNVYSFDFFNMVLLLKQLRKQTFPLRCRANAAWAAALSSLNGIT